MRRIVALLLVSTACAPMARAADCLNAADQRAMAECVGNARQQADTELNANYNRIVQRLKTDPDTTKILVTAQRAWIAFRDAECGFSTSLFLGGTLYPTLFSACVERLTRKRIDDLVAYLNCREGDAGCPVPSK